MERPHPDPTAGERAMLEQYLDHQRATLLWKCEGLDQAQLGMRTAASTLTLAGLLKHLALVEDHWFRHMLRGEEYRDLWRDIDWDADPDWEFQTAVEDDPDWLRGLYEQSCAASREAVALFASLDDLGARRRRNGQEFNLRWVLLHMIEETARHNGHADFLREAVDGSTGE